MQLESLSWEDPLEESMATHSSIHAWRIPWTEEPSGLQSIGSKRVKYNWSDLAHTHMQHWPLASISTVWSLWVLIKDIHFLLIPTFDSEPHNFAESTLFRTHYLNVTCLILCESSALWKGWPNHLVPLSHPLGRVVELSMVMVFPYKL